MIGLGLRQVQQALDSKADAIQREFIATGDELDEVGRELLEASPEQREPLREKQRLLRDRQRDLAAEVNEWRDRARGVRSQPGQHTLREYLNDLLKLDDPLLTPSIEHALYLLDAPEEELEKLAQQEDTTIASTQAGRLIQRARTDFDLRRSDIGARERAAVEFANRPGVAQQDNLVEEIEAAINDPDPMVKETAVLTVIQLHKFRCMRVADLDTAYASVQKLASLNHLAAVPVLVEVLENPRTGYMEGEDGSMVEADNHRSRMVALLRLIEWHTPEAKMAVYQIQFDQDKDIVKAAKRALELFPEDWSGPLRGTGRLPQVQAG
ncbi:MAG: hypothetical protein O6949_11470 [Chloroflexi bacterium]|nr:hypothetical protein [Chloroflexota bacterium]